MSMSTRDEKKLRLPVAPEHPDATPDVCRSLRTKTAFGSDGGPGEWKHGSSPTAVYWCLRTMETFGPDGVFSHPHACGPERRCHRSRDDA